MKLNRMSNQTPPENKRINKSLKKKETKTKIIRIDEADYKWLKEKAYIDRITMKELISKTIEIYKKTEND